jgi:hypothetical protein
VLAPLPLLVVELRRRKCVKEPILTSGAHLPGGICPPVSRPPNRFDDYAAGYRVELDFLGEIRLIDQRFWQADSSGVPNSNDPRLQWFTSLKAIPVLTL